MAEDKKNDENIKKQIAKEVLEITKSYSKKDIEELSKAKIALEIGIDYLKYKEKTNEGFGDEL